MPAFAFHRPTKKHGWITGAADAMRPDGVYRVLFRDYPYNENHPWWDQPGRYSGKISAVKLDDCVMISTEQAILLGVLIPKGRLTDAPEAP